MLSGLDLSVNKSEVFSVLGKSGTGKSVTLKCIVGLLVPDSGHVVVDSVKVDVNNRTDSFSGPAKNRILIPKRSTLRLVECA